MKLINKIRHWLEWKKAMNNHQNCLCCESSNVAVFEGPRGLGITWCNNCYYMADLQEEDKGRI